MILRPRPIAALVSAGILAWAGISMMSIRSVSGDSIAEAFYQAFGLFSLGLTGLALILGFTSFTRDQEREFSTDFKRCVECQEHVRKTATRCPDCGTDLIEAEAAEKTARRQTGGQPRTDDVKSSSGELRPPGSSA